LAVEQENLAEAIASTSVVGVLDPARLQESVRNVVRLAYLVIGVGDRRAAEEADFEAAEYRRQRSAGHAENHTTEPL
jgi:hypothetical protein